MASLIKSVLLTVEFQKVIEQFHSGGGEDGFGMILDADHGEFLVLDAHDFPFFGPGGDGKAVGNGLALDDEGVIARSDEGVLDTGVDALAVMEY